MSRVSVVLVHGAGSGPWVFDGWEQDFPDCEVTAVDLHAGLGIEAASMHDYAANLSAALADAKPPVVVVGWSMGGLVAMMSAASNPPGGLVLIEPSPPSQTQGSEDSVRPGTGSFDPEAVYGAFPSGMRARPESQLARDERKRGISVPTIGCPCLVVFGREFPEERGGRLAQRYGAEWTAFDALDHWDLVTSPEVRRAVHDWIDRRIGAAP